MDFSVLIGLACSVCGFAVAYFTFLHNSKKDSHSDGRESGTVLTEIGYIKANTDKIKAEQKEQRKVNTEVISRLTKVEASAKQAHHRLDRSAEILLANSLAKWKNSGFWRFKKIRKSPETVTFQGFSVVRVLRFELRAS